MSKITFASEKDLVDWYIENELSSCDNVYRELKIGNYGFADVVTWDEEQKIIHVYEFKNCDIHTNHFEQIVRYLKGISRSLGINDEDFNDSGVSIIGTIVCTGHKGNDCLYLIDFFDKIDMEIISIKDNTVKVENESGYHLKDEGNLSEIRNIFTGMPF